MKEEIQLLQFLICKDFHSSSPDYYSAREIHSNLYADKFPYHFQELYAVTCWRKDKRFHKEVIEYSAADGRSVRSPHMDIEPVTDTVLFRWHKHPFPADFPIPKPALVTVRVILDWKMVFESYVMIEKLPD